MLNNYTYCRLKIQECYKYSHCNCVKVEKYPLHSHMNFCTHNIYIDNEHCEDVRPSGKFPKYVTSQGTDEKQYQDLVARLLTLYYITPHNGKTYLKTVF